MQRPNPTYHRFTDSGNFLVIASTVAYTIGLTWGGITAPWDSATVLVPLVLGLVGLGVFIMYEATLAKYPLVRASLCALIRIVTLLVLGAVLPDDKHDQPQRVRNIIGNHPPRGHSRVSVIYNRSLAPS